MDKQLFDNAIGATPPSTVDVHAVIASQRRAARVRRVAGPGVVAVAAVVAVTFGATYALSDGGGTAGPAGSASSTSSAPDSAGPAPGSATAEIPEPAEPTCGPPPTEPIDDAEARLTMVLTGAVGSRLTPGARLTPSPAAWDAHGPLEVYHRLPHSGDDSNVGTPDCDLIDDYFGAEANVVDPAGTGSISALIGRLGGGIVLPTGCAGPDVAADVDCNVSTGPNGELIVASTIDQPNGVVWYRVDVSKPDGVGIGLSVMNLGATADQERLRPAERPEPPLTIEQLVGIALDPGMTLYPPA